jgi:hypothetical protein
LERDKPGPKAIEFGFPNRDEDLIVALSIILLPQARVIEELSGRNPRPFHRKVGPIVSKQGCTLRVLLVVVTSSVVSDSSGLLGVGECKDYVRTSRFT